MSKSETRPLALETSTTYFAGCGSVEAGSVVKHRNIHMWQDRASGEWHAEAMLPSVEEQSWTLTVLTSREAKSVVWRGGDVVITVSPNQTERLIIERAIDANRMRQ